MRSQFFACWSPLFGADKNRRRQSSVSKLLCHLKCFYIFSTLSDCLVRDDDEEKRKTYPATRVSHFYQNIYIKFNFLHMLSHAEEIFMLTQSLSSHTLINIIVVTLLPHHILFFSHGTHPCVISSSTHIKFPSCTCKNAALCHRRLMWL